MNDIGKHIRIIRTRQGMTQDQLAEALFVTRQSISNYETGKSRPDIDMLLRIADVLHTDMDSLLYGPVPKAAHLLRKKWALISGITFGVLLVAYQLLLSLIGDSWQTTYFLAPILLLRLTLRPAMFFALGWFILHCVSIFWKVNPLTGRVANIMRWILIGIGITIVLLLLPIFIYLLIAVYQYVAFRSVSLVFPPIPVYTQISNALLNITAKHSYVYAFLGAACRFFDIPRQKST